MFEMFARVFAAVGMIVADRYTQRKGSLVRLHDKGGKSKDRRQTRGGSDRLATGPLCY